MTEVEGNPDNFCNLQLKLPVPKVTVNGFKVLPTNNFYYSSTSNLHSRSHRRLRVCDNQQGAGGETPLSKTRRGGIRRAAVQSPAITVTRHSRARPPPLGPRLGPRSHRYRPPLLPPALSLVQPALYLPVLILVLLTPARNSASLPAPLPPSPPDGDNDADDQRSVNATLDPSSEDNRPRATQSTSSSSPPPTTEGGAEHSALLLPRSHSRSVRYLHMIIPHRRLRRRGIGGAEAEVVVVAGRGGSGRRGSGDSDNRVMFCVVCCGAGENSGRC